MKKVTPLISVDAIEPCLDFWTRLGLEVTATVPHRDAHGFAMLANDDVTIMYQTRASILADLGASGAPPELPDELAAGTSTLFIEVADIDSTIEALGEPDLVVPRRETFYGMDEIFVRAPCGTLVGFAARIG